MEHDDGFESVERDLRRLRPHDPAPEFRERVLQAVRPASLALRRGPAAAWRSSWAVDGLLAVATLLVIWLTTAVDTREGLPPATARGDRADLDCLAIDRRPGDWECRRFESSFRTPQLGWLSIEPGPKTEIGGLP